tara:strand:- start:20 stop:181 length:162 start_codon:yes stop_codon:yes gene_type:complete
LCRFSLQASGDAAEFFAQALFALQLHYSSFAQAYNPYFDIYGSLLRGDCLQPY